jgi:sporulation protein YtfJ
MEKIRQLVDVNTIIGEAITVPCGTTIIPISKVSFGFVSGGTDLPTSNPKEIFAGGSGAGVTIKPMTFLVVTPDGNVKVLDAAQKDGSVLESLFEAAPDFIEKVKSTFAKKKSEEAPPEDSGKKKKRE